ncbi:MAG: hypothetical protein RMK01_10585 [Thermomicrobium sp.]|nr:hypothetical protein [Thermomicrobium sp.]MDW8060507.1 hypothetical protein [Thermomicrobium sp.]
MTVLRPIGRRHATSRCTQETPRSSEAANGARLALPSVVVRATLIVLALCSTLLALSLAWRDRSEAITSPLLLAVAAIGPIATDGRVVVYARSSASGQELVVRSLSGDGERVVASVAGSIDTVSVSAETIVWQERDCPSCPSRLRVRRLTETTDLLVASASDERSPVLWRRWLAWLSRDGHDRLYVADLSSEQPTATLASVADEGTEFRTLRLHDGRLFWLEVSATGTWRLRTRPIAASSDPVTVLEGNAPAPEFLVAGSEVVTVSDDAALRIRPTSPRVVTLGTVAGAALVATDGQYVFWLDPAPAGQDGAAIVAYDAASGSRFVAVPAAEETKTLAASGGWLVWTRGEGALQTLWAAPISDLLPTAPRAAPSEASSTWRYFPETGHYLANGFRRFWERYGGTQLFGFPISEEFDELDPTTGAFRTVQYFERARFVWKPDNPGALEGVVLDRIGAELAERLDLPGTRPFRPVSSPQSTACRYFAETGHALCGGFLAAWLGTVDAFAPDLAVAADDLAVRLTGLPLSEPIALPDGTIAQYCERARLEYRRTSDQGGAVTRGRLGAELLQERGWLP